MRSGFIAIAGRPNVGKSTLLNRVLGSELSIVTPKAQTTRERVLGILTEKNRGQIIFIDTPGIHRARPGGLNAYMVDQARRALEDASILWVMVDPKSELEHEQVVLDLLAKAHQGSKLTRPKVYLLLNKADLPVVARGWTEPKVWMDVRTALGKAGLGPDREFTISALTGTSVPELVAATWSDLPEGPQYYNDEEQLSDRPLRYFVAEKVREQLYLQLGEELPYSCAVEITAFNETAKPLRIEANIHVERDSQKGMVIGKGGTKLKAIGTAARQKIEAFLDARVYLGLTVRVSRDWSQELKQLERLGYSRPEGTKEQSS